MNKKESKILALVLMLAMVLSVSMFMTSCSSDPSTLEEYVAQDDKLKGQLDQYAESQDGMTIEIKENQIIYTYTYPEQLDDEIVEASKEQFDNSMSSFASTFESIATSCEEQTKIKGITVKVAYLNKDGSEIWSKVFPEAE
ncbi:DUF4854 domain-containing protein [Ihubacter sp. rT4E-8]|uniref:DUF4854 domain-containing protein n=1 Tax=unclassified Ihubacter TaxID=2633299 RepID=UPI00137A7E56